MAELPDEIWGLIARKLVFTTKLAPISRKFYALTVRAISDIVDDVIFMEHITQFVAKTRIYSVYVSNRMHIGQYDVGVLSSIGCYICLFDICESTHTYQYAPGKIRRSKHKRTAWDFDEVAVSPLFCNYVVSATCTRYNLLQYPPWVLRYAGDCTMTAAKFSASE